MTTERELDLVISGWIRQGAGQPAPQAAIKAALAEVEATAQRRPGAAGLGSVVERRSVSLRHPAVRALLAAVLVLGLGFVAIVAGALDALIPAPSVSPAPQSSAGPSGSPPLGGDETFQYLLFDESGLAVRVPSDWQLLEPASAGLVRIAGDRPRGSLAISHGVGGTATLCDPECVPIELPSSLPFHVDRTLDAAQDAVSAIVGDSDWRPAAGLSPRLEGARRLDIAERDGRPARTYVIASYLTEVMLIVATLEGDRDEGVLESMLKSVRPMPLPGAKTGLPVPVSDHSLGVELRIPDVWTADAVLQGLNVRQYGDGRVTVSVVDEQGVLSVCEPVCRPVLLAGLVPEGTTLDLATLEAAVFSTPRSGVTSGDTMLAGVPARFQHEATTIAASYRVLALIDGVAIHFWVDLDRDDIDVSVAEAIAASLDYADPGPGVESDDRIVGEGFDLVLPEFWQGPWDPNDAGGISAVSGDARGRFWLCRWSGQDSRAIPCSIIQATTLEELDRNAGISGDRTETVLDGEPAIVIRVDAYEYPAAGGQHLAYVLAVHDGKPFVIRMLNRRAPTFNLDEVLAGFRFTN
jgi:hypothetical protein